MEVILTQDVQSVGQAGSVVRVKDGFARNFLIPNRLAVPATAESLKNLERQKQKKLSQMEGLKKQAEGLRDKLAGLSLTIASLTQEEGEKLFGSISAQEIAAALKEEGFDIDKERIQVPEPIKSLGIYQVPVKLHPEVLATVKVWVVKK